MNTAAMQAGAQVGDALFEIGKTNVWGISAQQIAPFFVGPAGDDGLFSRFLFIAARTKFTRVFSANNSDQRLQC
jgi:hypothetical protein